MSMGSIQSGGRYPVLRAIGIIYLIGAAILVVGGVAYACYAAFGKTFTPLTPAERLAWIPAVLACAFLGAVSLLALAELIKLAIDIEKNTRAAANAALGNPGAASTDPRLPTDGKNRIAALDDETAEGALLRGH